MTSQYIEDEEGSVAAASRASTPTSPYQIRLGENKYAFVRRLCKEECPEVLERLSSVETMQAKNAAEAVFVRRMNFAIDGLYEAAQTAGDNVKAVELFREGFAVNAILCTIAQDPSVNITQAEAEALNTADGVLVVFNNKAFRRYFRQHRSLQDVLKVRALSLAMADVFSAPQDSCSS